MNVYYNINKTMWAQIEFNKKHKYCPSCKQEFKGCETLMAYFPDLNSEDEVYRYYYNNNWATCQCGFKCRKTELISEEDVKNPPPIYLSKEAIEFIEEMIGKQDGRE